jgi:DNA sulfur modification protein DndE
VKYRLKTSENASHKIDEIYKSLKLASRATVIRIAVGMSLRDKEMPNTNVDEKGLDIARYTLTGDDDAIYKALITQHFGRKLCEDEYFPKLFNAHIERGINTFYSEYKLLGNKDKTIKYLLSILDI